MYASERHYVHRDGSREPKDRYEITVTKGTEPPISIDTSNLKTITFESMYWRKANHIHNWIVENVQNGNDDCNEYDVERDKLIELRTVCDQVIEASELVDGEVLEGIVQGQESNSAEKRLTVPGKVIKDPTIAQELLPRTTGCFFGSQHYDEEYLNDVIATRDWLNDVLDRTNGCWLVDILYQASW